jgi:hypothetical protein
MVLLCQVQMFGKANASQYAFEPYPFTLDPCSTGKMSYRSHREMSHTAQSDVKVLEKGEPILHWELPHSAPYGCNTMHQLFNQGLKVDHSECDDCPSEDESDIPAFAPHDFSDSDSSTGLEYDKFGEDPRDDLESRTYCCNSIKVSHIPLNL